MRVSQIEKLRYQAITRFNLPKRPEWKLLEPDLREAVQTVSQVLPFRTNNYVVERLIDWKKVPDDPIFRLTFPQAEMLDPEDLSALRDLNRSGASKAEIGKLVQGIRLRMNPHPAGQLSHNVPEVDGVRLEGVQHKYRETVLFFPAQGQTCHAYCTYCFRWPQFVGDPEFKFRSSETDRLIQYLRQATEVSDLLFTGGDPLVMKSRALESYVDPILEAGIEHLTTIRIGTKALAYWPFRFLVGTEASQLLQLFERVVKSGRHLALMAHFTHPAEMGPPEVREAVRRIRATGAEIRMQAPLVRRINDRSEIWADLWRQGVQMGMIPYYMFVERDTGPKEYFRVPLHKAQLIYKSAFNQVSGLARTVRGPSMSAFPGKVQVLGTAQIGREKVFVLQFLQARDPDWVSRPFFAKFDREAAWLDELEPAFGRQHFFFENDTGPWEVSTVA